MGEGNPAHTGCTPSPTPPTPTPDETPAVIVDNSGPGDEVLTGGDVLALLVVGLTSVVTGAALLRLRRAR